MEFEDFRLALIHFALGISCLVFGVTLRVSNLEGGLSGTSELGVPLLVLGATLTASGILKAIGEVLQHFFDETGRRITLVLAILVIGGPVIYFLFPGLIPGLDL